MTAPASAVADLLARAGDFAGGCRETALDDGRVALDFWSADPHAPVELERLLEPSGVDLELSSAPEGPGWREGMRAFHRPVVIGGRLRLRPPWSPAHPGIAEVVVDPGLAFGTGQHATTRMCLALLLDRPRGGVVDAGTGSGVLALAAARLGHAPVRAIDNDPRAVEAARSNAALNAIALDVAVGSLHDDVLPPVDGVLGNLTVSLMAPLAGALSAAPRWMILSGLRPFEVGEAASAFSRFGLAVTQRRSEEGWCALLLSQPAA